MLQGRTYVPMLHGRLAEMRALKELPSDTKNIIFPLIKARPWLGAKSLDKMWETINTAFEARSFGLDLDRTKFDPDDERPAYREFADLFDANNGFKNYYDLVENLERAVPIFRPGNDLQIPAQLDFIEKIGRGLIVFADVSAPINVAQIAEHCEQRHLENVVFAFDCGWGDDILQRAALCGGLIQSVLAHNENFEIVVGASSFPSSFTGRGEAFNLPIVERQLFQAVRKGINIGDIFYGDWGSTRPPADPVPMKNVPRIDFALRANWRCWRSNGDETYQDIAVRALHDDSWSGELGIWGEYMIEATAVGAAISIRAPAMAAAARVNIHMHVQAHFDNPAGLIIGDEPVGDDI